MARMSSPIRIGLVGAGRILPAHLRGYSLLRNAGIDTFRITAITSRTRRDAEAYLQRNSGPVPREPVSHQPADPLSVHDVFIDDFQHGLDVAVVDSIDALLDRVDAVDITSTLATHHAAALTAIAAGKHVMVQKPLAISVAAGRAMVDAARERRVSLGVMENLRYAQSARVARWLIDHGYLGELQMLARWSIGTAEWSPDKVVAETPWRHQKREAGGGASLDIGVHLMHELRYLAGPIDSVSAITRIFEPTRSLPGAAQRVHCDVDDAFFATVTLQSSAVAQLTFTWAGHGAPTSMPHGLAIYGSRGVLKGGTLVLDDGSEHSAAELFSREADEDTRNRLFPFGLTDPFALAFRDFLNGVAAGSDPEASGYEGLLDLAAAFAICESSTLQRPVSVSDVLDGRVAAYQSDLNAYYRVG